MRRPRARNQCARVHHSKNTEKILDIEITDQRDFDWNHMSVESASTRGG